MGLSVVHKGNLKEAKSSEFDMRRHFMPRENVPPQNDPEELLGFQHPENQGESFELKRGLTRGGSHLEHISPKV